MVDVFGSQGHGADGYRVHEIDAIEAALSWFEIELYPFDAILNG